MDTLGDNPFREVVLSSEPSKIEEGAQSVCFIERLSSLQR